MRVIASVVIGAGLLLMGGVAQAVDMRDLDVTIRVIDSDEHDSTAVTNEISLPDISREKVEHEKPESTTEKVETDTPERDTREVTGTDSTGTTSSFRDRTNSTDTTQTREFSRESSGTTKSDLREETDLPKTGTGGLVGGPESPSTSGADD